MVQSVLPSGQAGAGDAGFHAPVPLPAVRGKLAVRTELLLDMELSLSKASVLTA